MRQPSRVLASWYEWRRKTDNYEEVVTLMLSRQFETATCMHTTIGAGCYMSGGYGCGSKALWFHMPASLYIRKIPLLAKDRWHFTDTIFRLKSASQNEAYSASTQLHHVVLVSLGIDWSCLRREGVKKTETYFRSDFLFFIDFRTNAWLILTRYYKMPSRLTFDGTSNNSKHEDEASTEVSTVSILIAGV